MARYSDSSAEPTIGSSERNYEIGRIKVKTRPRVNEDLPQKDSIYIPVTIEQETSPLLDNKLLLGCKHLKGRESQDTEITQKAGDFKNSSFRVEDGKLLLCTDKELTPQKQRQKSLSASRRQDSLLKGFMAFKA